MDVSFSPHNRWVLSVGGKDRTAMQWRVLPDAKDDVLQQKPQVQRGWGAVAGCGLRVA